MAKVVKLGKGVTKLKEASRNLLISFVSVSQVFSCIAESVYSTPVGVAKVVKLGKGVTKLKEGQRVVGIPWTGLFGTWQQYRTMPAESLVSTRTQVAYIPLSALLCPLTS